MLQVRKNTLQKEEAYMKVLVVEDENCTIKFYMQELDRKPANILESIILTCKVKNPKYLLPIALVGDELFTVGETECLAYLDDKQSDELTERIEHSKELRHEVAEIIKKYFHATVKL